MALIRCGAGAAQAQKTEIWSNANPTAASFAGATVTVSESISDFDYIEVTYLAKNGTSAEGSAMISVTDFTAITPAANGPAFGIIAMNSAGTNLLARTIAYASATTVEISDAKGAASDNGLCIPLKIYGIK